MYISYSGNLGKVIIASNENDYKVLAECFDKKLPVNLRRKMLIFILKYIKN